MYPINNDYLDDKDDPEFDYALQSAMKKAGYIFPETEEDLDHAIAKFKNETFIIPDEINDPMTILRQGMLMVTTDFNLSRDEAIDENLAQAAREGGTIDEEVKDQMAKDRKDAEDTRGNSQNK